MKALGKLFGELVAWRWSPAVGLCVASLFYVLVVVALVPDEIGVPVTNARFAKKVAPSTDVSEAPTFSTAMMESEAPPPQPSPVRPAAVVDFGRRGFSPPLERPEPPPTPVAPPPMPVPPPAPPIAATPPLPAPAPPAGVEAPAAVEPAPDHAATMATSAPQPPAPGGIMRAIRSVLPGHFPPDAATPPAPPPGAEGPAPEAPAAPDAK
jgi:hypothetical protein